MKNENWFCKLKTPRAIAPVPAAAALESVHAAVVDVKYKLLHAPRT